MGPNETVYREFDMPEIPEDGALIKVEIAGICGSDVKNYAKPIQNVIMGHENVGVIAKAGNKFLKRKGVKEGDRVLLEHYLPDMTCEWCHQGEYRHCEATDWHTNPNAIRYGYTSADVAPHLWGGFAQRQFEPSRIGVVAEQFSAAIDHAIYRPEQGRFPTQTFREDPRCRGQGVLDDPGAPQATEVRESGDLHEDHRRRPLVAGDPGGLAQDQAIPVARSIGAGLTVSPAGRRRDRRGDDGNAVLRIGRLGRVLA